MEKKVKKRRNWSQEDMNNAVHGIMHGELTIRSAAKTYQIPRTTLQGKLRLKSPLVSKQGSKSILTQDMGKKVKTRRNWSQEDMNNAVRRIKHGELTIRSAAKTYQIPRSTLQDKIKLRSPLVSKQGPKPILTQSEEEAITRWTIYMDQLGFGQTKMDIQNVVKEMLDKSGRDGVFKDNLPGNAWFSSFKQRNPGLILWRPHPFRKHETVITPFIIDEWFTDFLQYLEEIKARTILCEPGRLYKCEESSFQLGGKAGKRVFKGKTATKVSQVKSSDDSQITVLATVSAEGCFPPPLIVLPSKNAHAPRTCKRGELKGAVYTQNQNGVMNPCTFLVFLTDIFQPFLIQKRVPCPVLLFVNGHSMYQSPEVTDFCTENGILLYQAPPHAASAPQVSNLSVAGCLNVEWDSAEKAYKENHPGCHVTRTIFPSVFCEAWKRIVAKPSVGVDGFKAVGIYPFTKMYNLTEWMATTSSTSKEFWPPNSDFATIVGDSAYSFLEDGIEAEGTTLSTSAEVPHSLHPPAGDTTAVVPTGSSQIAPDRTVILPGLDPVRVSSTTAMLLSRVVGVLEKNGSITLHMDKQAQDKAVSSTQESGIHCSTCRCSVEDQHQVPKELWKDFLKYQKKKEKKRRRREQNEQSCKRKGKKRRESDVSLERKGKTKKDSDMSLERKGKKRQHADVSQEKGKKRRSTDVSRERKGKKRQSSDMSQGKNRQKTGVSQGRKRKKRQDADSLQERKGKETPEADVSQAKETGERDQEKQEETGEREQEKQEEETAEREQEKTGMAEKNNLDAKDNENIEVDVERDSEGNLNCDENI